MKYTQPGPFTVGGVSAEYDEGHERTFEASGRVKRGRYRYDPDTKSMVEMGAPPPVEARTQISMDRHYENMAATDGTDIGSRRKHQEYMRRNGLAVADDFKGTWAKATQEREAYLQHGTDKTRRADIERALHTRRK